MSVVGQTEKNSVRAYVFRFALELGHCSTQSALRICATTGLTQRSKKLLDHLVRGRDKIGWKRKPKGAGSTEIDDEIELRGGVDGKIAGVGSAKDTIDVASS